MTELDYEMKQTQALNHLLTECNKSQALTIKHLKTITIVLLVCITLVFCTMVGGFFWYESQYEKTTETTTTTTLHTEGENAEINNVSNGDMYNDSATHTETGK